MSEDRPAPEQPGEALTGHDWSEGVELERDPSVEAAISNAMVGLKKRFFGKGPERARTHVHGRYVITILEGGTLRSEQSLLEAGLEDQVRNNRLAFQEAMAKPVTEALEQITGRKVLAYHSQIVFDPDTAFEMFVLEDEPQR